MFRIATTLLLGALALPALAGQAGATELFVPIKPGPGHDVVQSRCSICHSLDYIRTNSVFLSPDAWKAEVGKMRAVFGAPIDDADAETILNYLNANYGVPPKS